MEARSNPPEAASSEAAPPRVATGPTHAAPGTVTRFTTEGLPRQDAFAVWRESIAVLFDVRRRAPERNGDEDFHATLTTTQLGTMLLGETTASGQIFHRDLQRICADGVDHYFIQLYSFGEARARFHDTVQTITAGDLLLIDMAQPSSFVCSDFSNLTLVVPRPMLDARLPQAERLHGRVLPRDLPACRLAGETLTLLSQLAPGFGSTILEAAADAVLDLVVRCLSLSSISDPAGAPDHAVATLTSVKRFLEARLGDPALGPDAVLATFRMPPASLHELFEPYGGVVRYIERRRLARSLAALHDPANRHGEITDIAVAHGFASEGDFTSAFQRAFGMTPGEARDQPNPEASGFDDLVDRRYEAWLREILPEIGA